MRSLIVGGTFSNHTSMMKQSSIVTKLFEASGGSSAPMIINGASMGLLEMSARGAKDYDLVLWMADVDNKKEKIYPQKKTGGVLICSKVIRDFDNPYGDAVARIFKMHANAVIAIDKREKPYRFTLLDALGNKWIETMDIKMLWEKIKEFYAWSETQIRVKSLPAVNPCAESYTGLAAIERFLGINRSIAETLERERGGRYFGNCSTRCASLFPSMRTTLNGTGVNDALVSRRNVDKFGITPADLVYTRLINGQVHYTGDNKPSVDTAVQLNLYEIMPNINYMIHGHAYIEGAPTTSHYYPCGDLRELFVIVRIINNMNVTHFAINLKNHGFLIGGFHPGDLEDMVKTRLAFYPRELGEEIK